MLTINYEFYNKYLEDLKGEIFIDEILYDTIDEIEHKRMYFEHGGKVYYIKFIEYNGDIVFNVDLDNLSNEDTYYEDIDELFDKYNCEDEYRIICHEVIDNELEITKKEARELIENDITDGRKYYILNSVSSKINDKLVVFTGGNRNDNYYYFKIADVDRKARIVCHTYPMKHLL